METIFLVEHDGYKKYIYGDILYKIPLTQVTAEKEMDVISMLKETFYYNKLSYSRGWSNKKYLDNHSKTLNKLKYIKAFEKIKKETEIPTFSFSIIDQGDLLEAMQKAKSVQ